MGSSDVLDNKASQALTVGSAALPLTFALVAAGRAASGSALDDGWATAGFVVALVCYLGILLCNLIVGAMRGFSFRPDLNNLKAEVPRYLDDPLGGRVLKGYVADEYLASVNRNVSFLKWKARWVFVTQALLVFEGASLAIGAASPSNLTGGSATGLTRRKRAWRPDQDVLRTGLRRGGTGSCGCGLGDWIGHWGRSDSY